MDIKLITTYTAGKEDKVVEERKIDIQEYTKLTAPKTVQQFRKIGAKEYVEYSYTPYGKKPTKITTIKDNKTITKQFIIK